MRIKSGQFTEEAAQRGLGWLEEQIYLKIEQSERKIQDLAAP